ncbi:MAG TPA: hypothetical protein VGD31_16155 [Sphingobacteriaceae bacterium]
MDNKDIPKGIDYTNAHTGKTIEFRYYTEPCESNAYTDKTVRFGHYTEPRIEKLQLTNPRIRRILTKLFGEVITDGIYPQSIDDIWIQISERPKRRL